jgi:hypothetical protein
LILSLLLGVLVILSLLLGDLVILSLLLGVLGVYPTGSRCASMAVRLKTELWV